jgi:short-subunit dehydrogenase
MMGRRRFEGMVVLVTGASSGLGEELARQLAVEGAGLVLLARRKDRLEALARELTAAGADSIVVEADVTRDGQVEEAVRRAVEHFGHLDIVVANAGFSVSGRFDKLSIDDYRRQFETNVFGLLRTAKASLAELRKTKGRLVLIGSVAGHVALPEVSPYSMSKFAVRAFADAVGPELRGEGISLTLISPGFVDTEIRRVDNQGLFRADMPESVPTALLVPVSKAVREMLAAIHRRDHERIVTGHGKVIVWVHRFAPILFRLAGLRVSQARSRRRNTPAQ